MMQYFSWFNQILDNIFGAYSTVPMCGCGEPIYDCKCPPNVTKYFPEDAK